MLLAFQQEAVGAIVEGLAAGGRGQLRAAFGSGKSLVACTLRCGSARPGWWSWPARRCPLLAQTLTLWAAAGTAAHVLAVCSDDTVADAAVHVADLQCPVTTRPGEIADWVRRTPSSRMRLILVTHASIALVGKDSIWFHGTRTQSRTMNSRLAATPRDIEALATTHQSLVKSLKKSGHEGFTSINADWHFAIYTMSNTSRIERSMYSSSTSEGSRVATVPGRCGRSGTLIMIDKSIALGMSSEQQSPGTTRIRRRLPKAAEVLTRWPALAACWRCAVG